MASQSFFSEHTGTPPFVQPLLHALDRMQRREVLQPQQVTARAQEVLVERLGTSLRPSEAAFAHGGTGLIGAHTHYFDGFAVIMPLRVGTAVAIRFTEGPDSRIVFEGEETIWPLSAPDAADDAPFWVRLVRETVHRWMPPGAAVEVAMVSTVRPEYIDAYLSALGVATARAVQALFAVPLGTPALMQAVREIVEHCAGFPFSLAYPIAADSGRPGTFTLVDTQTFDHLPLEAPSAEQAGWGMVVAARGMLRDAALYRERRSVVEEAVQQLQQKAFPGLQSLRTLEHRHLAQALAALPVSYRPVIRHLVTENQRVQKLVAATRRKDWQMFGALLLMSQASVSHDWGSNNERVTFVVEQVENLTLDGMYGAFATGRGGCVLTFGKTFMVPQALDRIRTAFEATFGDAPEVALL